MITQKILELAMAKAVEVGLLPKYADLETYTQKWNGMRAVLEAVEEALAEESEAK